jgi:hypothetical protein
MARLTRLVRGRWYAVLVSTDQVARLVVVVKQLNTLMYMPRDFTN